MLRRINAQAAPYTATLQPRFGDQLLPAWTPVAPRGGWTPSAAWEAAQDYAATLSGREDLPPGARLEKCAYQTLLLAVPGLHRADVRERLEGRGAICKTDI